MNIQSVHPKKNRARILLSSVFGPYAQNDDFGSRRINPMELYQNQVTREQGAYSLRMFHRSFGLMLIQENIEAPCTLLDFPDLKRFTKELQNNAYDIVGISGIIPNLGKVKKMCSLVRQYLPGAVVVVGGHIANKPDLQQRIDADYIVKGEGIRWFRRFLGQDPNAAIRPLTISSGFGTRIMGHTLSDKPGDTAAILIPSVGCPMGCNFCSTSALFGGKGHFINFYETGDQLFEIMCRLERKLKVQSFFTMDENFLFHRKRALRLLELMQEHGKSWALYVFSSARVLQSYTMEQLLGLGIAWVWMGLEGRQSRYRKLQGIDTRDLVKRLQANGIRVLGSSIIGLEDHTPENMDGIIDHAVSHNTVFHQFMLYTPVPGTPLYAEHQKTGTLFPEAVFPPADTHGQYRFPYRHQHIPNGMEESFLKQAFCQDFDVNGPSLLRLIRTTLDGWLRHRHCRDKRIRDRFEWEVKPLRTTYAGAVWAMKRQLRGNKPLAAKANALLRDLYQTFGLKTRVIAPVVGMYLRVTTKMEKRRLQTGWTYEPATFCEKNKAARQIQKLSAVSPRRVLPDIRPRIVQPLPASGATVEP